jgi:acyl-CoA synthetase (NDP forming)
LNLTDDDALKNAYLEIMQVVRNLYPQAVIDGILIQEMITCEHEDRIAEMDVNPLLLKDQGLGVLAVDALIRLKQ